MAALSLFITFFWAEVYLKWFDYAWGEDSRCFMAYRQHLSFFVCYEVSLPCSCSWFFTISCVLFSTFLSDIFCCFCNNLVPLLFLFSSRIEWLELLTLSKALHNLFSARNYIEILMCCNMLLMFSITICNTLLIVLKYIIFGCFNLFSSSSQINPSSFVLGQIDSIFFGLANWRLNSILFSVRTQIATSNLEGGAVSFW